MYQGGKGDGLSQPNQMSERNKRGLNIGIVCYPTVGGSGVVATELGKKLAERGHTIHFISSQIPFRLKKIYPNIFYHKVEVNPYSVFQYPPYDLQLASKIAEVIKREKLDIIHAHYCVPHAVCSLLGREIAGLPVKIITTLHGTDITVLGQDFSLKELIRYGIEHSDRVTAVSHSLAQQTRDWITANADIQVIHNFVDEETYRKVDCEFLRKDFGIFPEEKVIIHVSNFRPVKRIEDVIRAFHIIQKEIPAKLLLVGDGPEMPRMMDLVDTLNLKEKVLFLGSQENLEELYSISDCMMLLSEKESFGLVLLEAMACGVPCIGTKIGGIPEVIMDGQTGFLCELGNIHEVARKTLTLLTNETLHHTFAEESLKVVRERFTSDGILEQYENLYYQLVEMEE